MEQGIKSHREFTATVICSNGSCEPVGPSTGLAPYKPIIALFSSPFYLISQIESIAATALPGLACRETLPQISLPFSLYAVGIASKHKLLPDTIQRIVVPVNISRLFHWNFYKKQVILPVNPRRISDWFSICVFPTRM